MTIHQVLQVPRVLKDQRVSKEILDLFSLYLQDLVDPRGLRVTQEVVTKVKKDKMDLQVLQGQEVTKDLKETKEIKVIQGRKGLPEPMVLMVPTGHRGPKEIKEIREIPA